MDVKDALDTWLFRGISDLYFSFYIDDWVFDYQSAFSSIMGLEKHLKATVIYYKRDKYESLSTNQAKIEIERIARKYGHNFKKMIKVCNECIGSNRLSNLVDQDYHLYNGTQLVSVLDKAYEETRYPTINRVSSNFSLDEPNTYHDPLSSSGLHRFIYTICEFLVLELENNIDLDKLLKRFTEQYGHMEQFRRFQNVFLKDKWPKY
ncbi:MAG: hypothetical protein G8D89_02090 [gamma proteobacterium symbiont of Clathrolucina costata]